MFHCGHVLNPGTAIRSLNPPSRPRYTAFSSSALGRFVAHKSGAKGGVKVGHVGGSIVGLRRRETDETRLR